jgi:hypothetical protein
MSKRVTSKRTRRLFLTFGIFGILMAMYVNF